MKPKSPLILYFRSSLNIIIITFSIIIGILSFNIFAGFLKLLIPGIIFIAYIVISLFFMSTKAGVTEIIKENEEDRIHKVEDKITELTDIRDTISYLRINDNEIRKSIEYFLLVSGNYLNKCKEINTYSPEANHEIEEVLKICQIYMEELDETVTEDRYGIKDNENFADYKKRTIDSITSCSNNIKQKTSTELTGLTRREQMDIIEEMESE